jgi:hypothetical protein
MAMVAASGDYRHAFCRGAMAHTIVLAVSATSNERMNQQHRRCQVGNDHAHECLQSLFGQRIALAFRKVNKSAPGQFCDGERHTP